MAKVVFLVLFLIFLVYSAAVYTSGTAKVAAVMNDKAKRGKMSFQEHNCIACHQLYGLGGYLGPELTSVTSQPRKTDAYLRAVITNGNQRMPSKKISPEESDELIEYLKYIYLTKLNKKHDD